MKIGYRAIKTAIGVPIAVLITQWLGISNFVSAGILTILCIQPSRKRSLKSAWSRFLACIIAGVLSILFFEFIGYHPLALGLMLAVFIPITVMLKVTAGIASSTVITLNLYSYEIINTNFLIQQLLVIVVGIGTGLILNLYMPSLDSSLKKKQLKLEHNYKAILYEIAVYLRDKDVLWDGKEIIECSNLLEEANDLVERDYENHILRTSHPYRDYFRMREKQFELLKRMLPLVTRLPNNDSVSERIAHFFEELANVVHPGNTASIYLDELKKLRKEFNEEDLPKTQEEFETRANLFQLLQEIEDYLIIKRDFKKSDVKHQKKTRSNKKETGSVL